MSRPTILHRLHEDHRRLSQVFAVLEHQMQRFSRTEGGPDFGLLQNLIDYVIEYPDAVHHPLENRLFERVVGKGVTPAEDRLVSAILVQHVEIKAATRKLAEDVRWVLNGAVIPAQKLQADVSAYIDLQRAHMLVEERQLLPLANRLLSNDDWTTLENELGAIEDPMFDQAVDRFADLHRYIVQMDQTSDG